MVSSPHLKTSVSFAEFCLPTAFKATSRRRNISSQGSSFFFFPTPPLTVLFQVCPEVIANGFRSLTRTPLANNGSFCSPVIPFTRFGPKLNTRCWFKMLTIYFVPKQIEPGTSCLRNVLFHTGSQWHVCNHCGLRRRNCPVIKVAPSPIEQADFKGAVFISAILCWCVQHLGHSRH